MSRLFLTAKQQIQNLLLCNNQQTILLICSSFIIFEYNDQMFVWGRNNNHLFKQNHKKTYSLPQRMPVGRQVHKCVAGYDYILMLSSQSLFCYFQSAIYHLTHFQNAIDVATTDNMIVVITADGNATIAEFNADKIITGELTYSKLQIKQKVGKVFMNYGEIFLVDEEQKILHLKRNEWYETKSYSDPTIVEGFGGKKIKSIAPAISHNYFLTEDGKVFISTKKQPTKAVLSGFKNKFVEIAASDYFIGIADNGRLYLCGKYLDKIYETPSEFAQISQKFIKISLGSDNGFGITQKGEGWVWGKNANGQLGLSDYEPRTQPFPIVTLQSDNLNEFIVGEGYTICLAQNPHSKKSKLKACEIMNESAFPVNDHSKSNHFMISSIPSISIAEPKKSSKPKSPNNATATFTKTENLRDHPRKLQRVDSNTPTKQRNRLKSPYENTSNSKSPVSNYVIPKQKSQTKKELSKPTLSPKKVEGQSVFQIQQLQQQNTKLKQMLKIKQEVIEDITNKIRLLEDAIEQHERTLTNRDHLMEQYQKREKQYLSHIDELQKAIEDIMKNKTDRSSEQIDGMFHDLKTEFNKEKDYYMTKMKEYEDLLNNQRSHYHNKIKELEIEVETYRSGTNDKNLYTLNESRSLALRDRSQKDNMRQSNENVIKQRIMEENRHKMELIVSRIEDSKVRIGKSANKLTQFLTND